MKISVIIPTLQAEKYIVSLLSALRQQTILDLEIVIIDSSSTDQTVALAEAYADQIIVIPKAEFDHGRTRNRAVRAANGSILVFLTQDALPTDKYFLANLIKPLAEGKVAASYGRQVAKQDASMMEKFARGFNYPLYDKIKSKEDLPSLGIKTFFFTNVCSAVKRENFALVGGFSEKIILNEDMILAAKLILSDYKIAYVAQASVIHSHHYTYVQQLQRNFDIGVSLKMNDWVLAYAKAEKEGWRYLKEQFVFLKKQKQYAQMGRCFWDSAFRYMGYKLGLHYQCLPLWLRKKCSMHRFFWE